MVTEEFIHCLSKLSYCLSKEVKPPDRWTVRSVYNIYEDVIEIKIERTIDNKLVGMVEYVSPCQLSLMNIVLDTYVKSVVRKWEELVQEHYAAIGFNV